MIRYSWSPLKMNVRRPDPVLELEHLDAVGRQRRQAATSDSSNCGDWTSWASRPSISPRLVQVGLVDRSLRRRRAGGRSRCPRQWRWRPASRPRHRAAERASGPRPCEKPSGYSNVNGKSASSNAPPPRPEGSPPQATSATAHSTAKAHHHPLGHQSGRARAHPNRRRLSAVVTPARTGGPSPGRDRVETAARVLAEGDDSLLRLHVDTALVPAPPPQAPDLTGAVVGVDAAAAQRAESSWSRRRTHP